MVCNLLKVAFVNSILFLSINTETFSANYYDGINVFIEENKGQVMNQHREARPDVLFIGESEGMTFQITNKGISYQLSRVDQWSNNTNQKSKSKRKADDLAILVPELISIHRVDVQWINPSLDFRVVLGEAITGYSNYYNVPAGNNPALNVKQYKSITLKDIWEGVDLIYYSRDGHLESDWVVKSPSDYQKIAFEVKGADLSVGQRNQLFLQTPFGNISEGKLIAYQGKKTLPCAWKVDNNQVRIQVENFNPLLPLTIDPPIRVWGTYCGGNAPDRVTDLVSDGDGNLFHTGFSMSLLNIATDGVHQSIFGGGIQDAYISKFNTDGDRVWSSYFGGEASESGQACTLDNLGHAYIAGETRSTTNIATNDAHQVSFGGEFDAYLAKFNSENGALIWASYFGGAQFESCWDAQADNTGNVYLCGITDSENAIASSNAHQVQYAGGFGDGFIVKFGPEGQLIWSTYYGGDQYDEAYGVASDALGNVYLTGLTYSENQIATAGSHQATFSGEDDAFLVKFNEQGIREWGTYIGGENFDEGFGCAVDVENTIYVIGGSASAQGIATTGAYQSSFNDERDAFLMKFDGSGTRIWGTYYGGEGYEDFWCIHINSQGFIYAGGQTNSALNIASVGAFQSDISGSSDDGFLVKFDNDGQFKWGTYFGGSNYDDLYGIATDNSFNVYIAGGTQSLAGIATPGSFQSEIASSSDGYLVKFFDQEETPTGFEEFLIRADLMVYPNPARDFIRISSTIEMDDFYQVLDIHGKIVQTGKMTGKNLEINLNLFAKGLYRFQLEQGYGLNFIRE
ncbi:MAG: SBBP repeat-containing protein [Bacteroidia bacterium]